jgi:TonB family protein
MLEMAPVGLTKRRTSAAFMGSVLIHAGFALFLLRMTLPQTSPRISQRFVAVYVPAADARNPPSPPTPRRDVPQHVSKLPLPPPARVPVTTPELRSISSPEATPPILPRPKAVPPPEIEPGAIRLSSPVLQVGVFDSPPAHAAQQVSDSTKLQVGKFDQPTPSLPAREDRGPIASAGFGSAAEDRPVRANQSAGALRPGSFGAVEALRPRGPSPRAVTKTDFDSTETRATPAKVGAPGGRSNALEILDKPRPLYSDEARKLKIEGVVVLEMSFGADGHGRVLRVIRGLGHGLDDNAIRAAVGIRFLPAVYQGAPVDTVALVRIEFQMAY